MLPHKMLQADCEVRLDSAPDLFTGHGANKSAPRKDTCQQGRSVIKYGNQKDGHEKRLESIPRSASCSLAAPAAWGDMHRQITR